MRPRCNKMLSFRMFGTPIRVKPEVSAGCWPWAGATAWGLSWHPQRGFWQAVLIGFVTMFPYYWPTSGMRSPTFSARDMPGHPWMKSALRPHKCRTRSMPTTRFRPTFTGCVRWGARSSMPPCWSSSQVLAVAPPNSVVWELGAWSAAAHSLMPIMSLAPVPDVDGETCQMDPGSQGLARRAG